MKMSLAYGQTEESTVRYIPLPTTKFSFPAPAGETDPQRAIRLHLGLAMQERIEQMAHDYCREFGYTED